MSDDVSEMSSSSSENSGKDVETLYARSISLKQSGNEKFAQGNSKEAKKDYLKGVRLCRQVSHPGKNELMKSLFLNLSICYLNLQVWDKAANAATNALRYDSKNVKALYRRAQARVSMSQIVAAKEDFREILKYDPSNNRAKIELAKLAKDVSRSADKGATSSFSGMFQKGMGLYDDREKQMEETRKRQIAQNVKDQEEWQKAMELKRAAGEEELSFENWKEIRDNRNSAKSTPPPTNKNAAEKPQKALSPADSAKDENVEFDEEEQKILEETKRMGYYYFNRPNAGEKKEPSRPKLISESDAAEDISKRNSASNWNVKGTTYEEKDMTTWAKTSFTELLSSISVSNDPMDLLNDISSSKELLQNYSKALQLKGENHFDSKKSEESMESLFSLAGKLSKTSATVTKIDNLNGEAHISIVRGTPRYFFDFSALLLFEITIHSDVLGQFSKFSTHSTTTDSENVVYEGELQLQDVSNIISDSSDWLKDSRVTFKKSVSSEHKHAADEIMKRLKSSVQHSIDEFVKAFQTKL